MRIICFEMKYVGFKKNWQRIADTGNLIDAVKELRKNHTPQEMSLRKAVDIIKEYMKKNKILVVNSRLS